MVIRRTPPAAPSTQPSGLDRPDAPGGDEWLPVPRKPRRDGWTPERQRAFIAALGQHGCVEQAARAVGISAKSCYALRRAPAAEGFAAAWDAALRHFDARARAAWRLHRDAAAAG